MFARACVLAALCLGVSGCDDVSSQLAEGLSRIGSPRDATGEGIRTLALLGGDVRVRGPEGYCIDQTASNARAGFAVLAGCALMTDDVVIMPDLDGLITVQFAGADSASVTGAEAEFAAFLESPEGRSILASDGQEGSVGSISTEAGQGRVLVRFEDQSGPVIEGTRGPQWRGFMDIRGRLVTVTVFGFERAPLSQAEGARLLSVTLAELTRANEEASS